MFMDPFKREEEQKKEKNKMHIPGPKPFPWLLTPHIHLMKQKRWNTRKLSDHFVLCHKHAWNIYRQVALHHQEQESTPLPPPPSCPTVKEGTGALHAGGWWACWCQCMWCHLAWWNVWKTYMIPLLSIHWNDLLSVICVFIYRCI